MSARDRRRTRQRSEAREFRRRIGRWIPELVIATRNFVAATTKTAVALEDVRISMCRLTAARRM